MSLLSKCYDTIILQGYYAKIRVCIAQLFSIISFFAVIFYKEQFTFLSLYNEYILQKNVYFFFPQFMQSVTDFISDAYILFQCQYYCCYYYHGMSMFASQSHQPSSDVLQFIRCSET